MNPNIVSSLQSIKRVVDRRTVDLFFMFNEELNLVKKEFNRQSASLTPFQPLYAGKATWARSLKKRIDTPMKVGYQIDLCTDFL